MSVNVPPTPPLMELIAKLLHGIVRRRDDDIQRAVLLFASLLILVVGGWLAMLLTWMLMFPSGAG